MYRCNDQIKHHAAQSHRLFTLGEQHANIQECFEIKQTKLSGFARS